MGLGRDIAYGAAAVASSPVWGAYLLRTGKWRTDWGGRFGRCDPRAKVAGGKRVLLHAVSVGEVNATRALVAALTEADASLDLVVATTTNTGYARATALYGEHPRVAGVVRFPFDFSRAVGRMLDAVRPDAVALVELEVWPNLIEACARRGVPVGVVNGRLSENSFRGYRRFRAILCPTFAKLAAVGAQTMAYADRFEAMGVPADRVCVLDTMKWDTAGVQDASTVDGADELAAAMGIDRERPLVVAGSTGPGEEAMLIEACPAEAQLMLVPRKPERFDEVAALAPMVRRSAGPALGRGDATSRTSPRRAGPETTDAQAPRLFLLDTMGELRKAYALADVVVVGRSFNGMGGSDPIEPIGLGKPVVIGPDVMNFADVVTAFEQRGGIVRTQAVGDALRELLGDEAKRGALGAAGLEVIRSRQGATQRYAAMVMGMLERPGQAASNAEQAAR